VPDISSQMSNVSKINKSAGQGWGFSHLRPDYFILASFGKIPVTVERIQNKHMEKNKYLATARLVLPRYGKITLIM
jgi:hypothetical protein